MEKTVFKTTIKTLLSLVLTAAAATSCDTIYDDTDDCAMELRVKFRYDMNMKFADAFPHEVKKVNLYVYDADGKLALHKQEQGEALAAEGYSMSVNELTPGIPYTWLVWAEGENRGDSYTWGPADSEQLLSATLNTTTGADGRKTLGTDLTPLFHGRLDGRLYYAGQYGTTQTLTLPLTKDTKNIKIVLQELDGSADLKADDYRLEITDNNTSLAYDNSIASADPVVYHPWSVTTGKAGTGTDGTQVAALVAEFTTNRLVKDVNAPRLTVSDKTGKTLFSIPLIDYFLLVKGNYLHEMSDQEYLDREDTYNMTFFLSHGTWAGSYIYINSWRVVPPQNGEMK